jgi:hypothetical protein
MPRFERIIMIEPIAVTPVHTYDTGTGGMEISVFVKLLKELKQQKPPALIVIDEGLKSINPDHSLALIMEISEELAKMGHMVFLVNHHTGLLREYQESEQMGKSGVVGVGLDHKLSPSGMESNGFAAAIRYGLPPELVNAASARYNKVKVGRSEN